MQAGRAFGKSADDFKIILTIPLGNRDQNERECQWLEHEPERLLAHYQPVVEIVVRQFIARGFFQKQEQEELKQEINLQLLEKKLSKIKKRYKGSVKLKTYFSKVVYNTCLEIARLKARQPILLTEEVLIHASDRSLSPFQQMAIRDEVFRLEGILKGMLKKRHKAEFNFKLLIRFLLTQTDIQFYESPKTKEVIALIRDTFFRPYDHLNDKEVYEIAVQLFNILEQKSNDGDSLRRWVNTQRDRIITLLNGSPAVSAHTPESIKLLLYLYFSRPLRPNVKI